MRRLGRTWKERAADTRGYHGRPHICVGSIDAISDASSTSGFAPSGPQPHQLRRRSLLATGGCRPGLDPRMRGTPVALRTGGWDDRKVRPREGGRTTSGEHHVLRRPHEHHRGRGSSPGQHCAAAETSEGVQRGRRVEGTPRLSLSAKIDNLRRGGRLLFADLEAEFPRGLTLLLGPNGVGKTSLLEQLAVLRTTAEVQVTLDGQRGHRSDLAQVGSLAQRDPLIPSFKVQEYLEYSAWLKGLPTRSALAAASSIAEEFDLGPLMVRRIRKLSGGQKQRVAAAASMVHRPEVWLLDEPFNDLDPEQRSFLAHHIENYARDHVVVVSTHLLEEIPRRADQCLVLRRMDEMTQVVFSGSEDSMRSIADGSLEIAYTRLVGGAP